jgi:hypothetical protein
MQPSSGLVLVFPISQKFWPVLSTTGAAVGSSQQGCIDREFEPWPVTLSMDQWGCDLVSLGALSFDSAQLTKFFAQAVVLLLDALTLLFQCTAL